MAAVWTSKVIVVVNVACMAVVTVGRDAVAVALVAVQVILFVVVG